MELTYLHKGRPERPTINEGAFIKKWCNRDPESPSAIMSVKSYFSFFVLCASFVSTSVAYADVGIPFADDFSQPTLSVRTLGRGPWKVSGSTAQCTQDDELYKKFKDHGPMITYAVPFSDAAVRYSFKPDAKVKNVVFTINSTTGHVLRIVASSSNSRAFVFTQDEHKNKPLATDLPKFKVDEWNETCIEVRGKQVSIKIGDYAKSFTSEEVVVPKSNVTLGFSFGTLAVRDIKIDP